MSILNPLDNDLANMLRSVTTRLQALENSRQPYISDWIQVPDTFTVNDSWSLTYNSNNPILITYLRAGTWIRWKQLGDTSYRFAIIANTKSAVNILGILYTGYNFTPALNVIEFWYSNSPTPFGAPFSYDIGPLMQVPSQLGSNFSVVSSSIRLVNTGNLITLVGDVVVGVTGGASATAFFGYFPICDPTGNHTLILATGNLAGPIGLGVQSNSLSTIQTTLTTTTGTSKLTLGFQLPLSIPVGSNISVALCLPFVILS